MKKIFYYSDKLNETPPTETHEYNFEIHNIALSSQSSLTTLSQGCYKYMVIFSMILLSQIHVLYV